MLAMLSAGLRCPVLSWKLYIATVMGRPPLTPGKSVSMALTGVVTGCAGLPNLGFVEAHPTNIKTNNAVHILPNMHLL